MSDRICIMRDGHLVQTAARAICTINQSIAMWLILSARPISLQGPSQHQWALRYPGNRKWPGL